MPTSIIIEIYFGESVAYNYSIFPAIQVNKHPCSRSIFQTVDTLTRLECAQLTTFIINLCVCSEQTTSCCFLLNTEAERIELNQKRRKPLLATFAAIYFRRFPPKAIELTMQNIQIFVRKITCMLVELNLAENMQTVQRSLSLYSLWLLSYMP